MSCLQPLRSDAEEHCGRRVYNGYKVQLVIESWALFTLFSKEPQGQLLDVLKIMVRTSWEEREMCVRREREEDKERKREILNLLISGI